MKGTKRDRAGKKEGREEGERRRKEGRKDLERSNCRETVGCRHGSGVRIIRDNLAAGSALCTSPEGSVQCIYSQRNTDRPI